MNVIPKKLREEIARDPYYKHCAREGLHGHECAGRITWEHAMYFCGKQIQKKWCIIPLCAKAHNVDDWQDCGDLNKEVNEWVALNRATQEEVLEISRAIDYFRRRAYLNQKLGTYVPPGFVPSALVINY